MEITDTQIDQLILLILLSYSDTNIDHLEDTHSVEYGIIQEPAS